MPYGQSVLSNLKWSPGIGDPTWIGWLITVAYFGAAWLCFESFLRFRLHAPGKRVWLVIATVMLLLGFNKQLDLQTLFTEIGRWMARREGWFDQRRQVQAAFVVVMIVLAAGSTVAVSILARRLPRQLMLSLIGMVVLFAFVVLRAATFEHFKMLPSFDTGLNATMELGGIACVAAGAWRWRMRARREDLDSRCIAE